MEFDPATLKSTLKRIQKVKLKFEDLNEPLSKEKLDKLICSVCKKIPIRPLECQKCESVVC